MRTFNLPIVVLLLVTLTSFCLGYTAPSTIDKFRSVLAKAKLQAPYSSPAVRDLSGFANSYFHVQGDRYIQFQMNGNGRRSELRQMKNRREVSWDVRTTNTLEAKISLPKPSSDVYEATFLQVHCTEKPALRISMKRSKDGKKEDIVATLRTGLGNDDVEKEVIAKRESATKRYKVRVERSIVTVSIGEMNVYSKRLDFWEGHDCYFKAGVYIQDSRNNETKVRTKFDYLYWN